MRPACSSVIRGLKATSSSFSSSSSSGWEVELETDAFILLGDIDREVKGTTRTVLSSIAARAVVVTLLTLQLELAPNAEGTIITPSPSIDAKASFDARDTDTSAPFNNGDFVLRVHLRVHMSPIARNGRWPRWGTLSMWISHASCTNGRYTDNNTTCVFMHACTTTCTDSPQHTCIHVRIIHACTDTCSPQHTHHVHVCIPNRPCRRALPRGCSPE